MEGTRSRHADEPAREGGAKVSQVVCEDVRCGECGEMVHFWTKYRTPEGTVETEAIDRRCSCQMALETMATAAQVLIPEPVLRGLVWSD